MKGILLNILLFGQLITVLGQDSNLGVSQANNRLTTRTSVIYDDESAYLSKDWKTGRVYFLDGTSTDLIINYNAYNMVLEQLQDGNKLTFDKPVKSFILGDTSTVTSFLYLRGFQDFEQQTINSYYKLVYETPNFRLLKYSQFKVREKRGFNEANTTVNFDLFEDNFIAFSTGQLQKVRLNKKQIINTFPKFQSEIEEFINSKNLKFKDWSDVSKVLDYVETLF